MSNIVSLNQRGPFDGEPLFLDVEVRNGHAPAICMNTAYRLVAAIDDVNKVRETNRLPLLNIHVRIAFNDANKGRIRTEPVTMDDEGVDLSKIWPLHYPDGQLARPSAKSEYANYIPRDPITITINNNPSARLKDLIHYAYELATRSPDKFKYDFIWSDEREDRVTISKNPHFSEEEEFKGIIDGIVRKAQSRGNRLQNPDVAP